MNSKKINQLSTELTPSLSDLTIIGDPLTGVSKKITLSQMASLFTGTVEEYPSFASFPLVGVADTIYIATDTNILYRWDTSLSAYAELSPNIVTSLVFSDANGFDGTISLVGSVATLTITTALTTGSVPFIGASGALSQDNANLFFDDTNNRLGINTNSPTTALDVFGSGIIGRINGTSTNNAFLGFASAGTNKWSIGNVQSDHRFRIYNEATTSELVSVLQTGEFGIGIANPTTKFHIDGAASALIANLDANVSVAKSISFRSDNSARINLEVSGTESGSNAGANFYLRTYTDAGALLATPITITRSTGAISLATALSGTSAAFTTVTTTGEFISTTGFNAKGNGSDTAGASPYYLLSNTAGNRQWASQLGTNNEYRLHYYNGTSWSNPFTIASTGAATFTNSVEGTIINSTSNAFRFSGNNALSLVTLNSQSVVKVNAAGFWGVQLVGANDQGIVINNLGDVGIGSTSPSNFGGGGLTMGSTSNGKNIIMYSSSNGNNGLLQFIDINNSNSLQIAGTTTNQSFYGYGDRYMNFSTNGGERVRITASGYLKAANNGSYNNATGTYHEFNNSNTGQNNTIFRSTSTSNNYGPWIFFSNESPNNTSQYFLAGTDSTNDKFFIYSNGNITNRNGSYGTISSDIRLKENITPATSKLDDIMSLNVVNFAFKDDTEKKKHIGFIAQEFKEIFPSLVYQRDTRKYDDEGNLIEGLEDSLGLAVGMEFAILVKAIQEQQAQIEELKALIYK